jgi:hypothetical protein
MAAVPQIAADLLLLIACHTSPPHAAESGAWTGGPSVQYSLPGAVLEHRDWGSTMRVGLCLMAAGLFLSGCASSGFLGGSLAEKKEMTSGTAPPAAGRPLGPQYARDNDNCVVWEQNAYHPQCDPNANY